MSNVDTNNKDDSKIRLLEQELEKAKNEAKEYETKYKYLLAEYDNYRKRLEKEAELRVKHGIETFILKLLDLRDDYIRAIDTVKKGNEKSINAIVSGLEGILKKLDNMLKEVGVVEIEALGKIFDPNLHEAVSFTYNSELPDLTVTNEIRKGYMLNDRVIRPSLVEVSRRPMLEGGDGKNG
jgi:molecular chaperone GrpE